MKKKNVAIVIPTLQGNGAERMVLTLAEGFIQQGYTVNIVLTLKRSIELKSSRQLKIHYFKKYYRWIPKIIRGIFLAPILDKFIVNRCDNPNLVLSNLLPSDRMLCYSKLNTYLIIHNTISKQNNNFAEMRSIYTKKPVICVSQGVKTDFDRFFNSRFPSYYIYNPIDVDFINQESVKFKPKYHDYLVHVGKFKKQKRHDILIKAYHQSGIENPLILLGKGHLKEKYKKLVNNLNLNEKVIFAGFQPNPYPFIKYARLMVLSSDFEGFGMVITEALALKTPVISTDCPSGPSEILPKNNLVPVNDIEKLAQLMQQANNNPLIFSHPLNEKFYLDFSTKKYIDIING